MKVIITMTHNEKEYALGAKKEDFEHTGDFLKAVQYLSLCMETRVFDCLELPKSASEAMSMYYRGSA